MGVKENYQEKVDAQLYEWKGWVENYKSDPDFSGSKKTVARQQMIDRLDDCHKNAQIRLAELRASPDQHWELAKQVVERAMIDLKRLLDESGAVQVGRSLSIQASRPLGPYSKRG